MNTQILLPNLGTPDVTVSVWFAGVGDRVYEGDRLLEVLLGAATFDIEAPATGTLVERWAEPGDRLKVGQILGIVAGDE